MFELMETAGQQAVIKVLGIGGGGGNAVDHMLSANLEGVEFINANTDAQALRRSGVSKVLQLGENLTKGLGAGTDPDVGRQAATEDRDKIAEVLDNTDMVFLTAGMGWWHGYRCCTCDCSVGTREGYFDGCNCHPAVQIRGAKAHTGGRPRHQ